MRDWPQSTVTHVPTTHEARGETRNVTTSAISSTDLESTPGSSRSTNSAIALGSSLRSRRSQLPPGTRRARRDAEHADPVLREVAALRLPRGDRRGLRDVAIGLPPPRAPRSRRSARSRRPLLPAGRGERRPRRASAGTTFAGGPRRGLRRPSRRSFLAPEPPTLFTTMSTLPKADRAPSTTAAPPSGKTSGTTPRRGPAPPGRDGVLECLVASGAEDDVRALLDEPPRSRASSPARAGDERPSR